MQIELFTFATMDSLTQIVLGAACGEAILGKKLGNKAMLFGAIGGTIPDLDVIFGKLFFSNNIDQLAFHRGFMHSILFAIIGSFVLGYLIHRFLYSKKKTNTTTQKEWILLFFLSIFTHPILDSFTPYGTQLFRPFSDYRVALNNIAVVDPMYTIPFLVCLLVAMFYKRTHKKRWQWVKTGIIISSLYMLFTLGNKLYIDSVFQKSLTQKGFEFKRFRTQPTIFNNILWYGIAETNTDYKVGYYSLLDSKKVATHFISIPKNHDLLNMQEPDLKTLTWFSNGYYNLVNNGKAMRYNDLRYPILNPNDPNSSIFSFILTHEGNRWKTSHAKPTTSFKKGLAFFWNRLKGI